MGSQSVKAISTQKQRTEFVYHLLNDIKVLTELEKNDRFEKGIQRIGAEQELCITKENFRPSTNALEILDIINDPHYTTELALFNLEINLDPIELTAKCFGQLEYQLNELLKKGYTAAETFNDKILLAGILPTLKKKDLIFENMTPIDRYKTLNKVIKNIRGNDFNLHLKGVDELILEHESILFEACNTSFQVHLQIGLDEIVDKYNWSQAIAGPMLSVMTNSPLLLGKELWSETRIALFQQSIDLRNRSYLLREQKPRVSFGNNWVKESFIELFTDDIARYAPLVTTEFNESSMDQLNRGKIPKLKALSLHNGTLYKWNRLCYGVADNIPHLRIENRYIPAGPSVKDEIANALFWVGVMQGMPEKYKNISDKMQFKDARGNFIKAARTGIDTYFNWFNEGVSAKDLMLKTLLPMARKGLVKSAVNSNDIDTYLGIIEQRVIKNTTGSKWQIRGRRSLLKKVSSEEANILLSHEMYTNQRKGIPVHEWDSPKVGNLNKKHKYDKLFKIMKSALYVVNENDLLTLVKSIMDWKNIHHLPVVNNKNKIVGMISSSTLEKNKTLLENNELLVAKDIMIKEVKTAAPDTSFDKAKKMMDTFKIGCLPIIEDGELVGIITKTDIQNIDNKVDA